MSLGHRGGQAAGKRRAHTNLAESHSIFYKEKNKKNVENHVFEVLVSRGFRTVLNLSKHRKEAISWRFSGSNVHILGESVTKSVLSVTGKEKKELA